MPARMGSFTQPSGPYGGPLPTVHPQDNILTPSTQQMLNNEITLANAETLAALKMAQTDSSLNTVNQYATPLPTPYQYTPPPVSPDAGLLADLIRLQQG